MGYIEIPRLDDCPNTDWTDSMHVWLSESAAQIAEDLQRTLLPKLEELLAKRRVEEERMATAKAVQMDIVQQLIDAGLSLIYMDWSDAYSLYLRDRGYYISMQVPSSGVGVKVNGNIPASAA